MKRQAISISLETIDKLKGIIEEELESLEKIIPINDKKKIAVQFNIINRTTKCGKKKMYCSDTWKFEL